MTETTEQAIAEAVSDIHEKYRTDVLKGRFMGRMSQAEYLAILFGDAGYDTAKQRKGWLQLRYGKDFPDELTTAEAHSAIEALKAEKSSKSVTHREED